MKIVAGQQIQLAHELACVVVDLLIAFLEFIQLLQDYNRQVDVVFLEIQDAVCVMQHHVGVENEILLVG